MKMQLHCIITGRVQGVMFRDFAQRKARGLDISGTVKNQPDGSVEIMALGEEKSLRTLLELLHKGPILTRMINRIDNVDTEWSEATQNFNDFKIIY